MQERVEEGKTIKPFKLGKFKDWAARSFSHATRMRYPVDAFGTHSEILEHTISFLTDLKTPIVILEIGTGGLSSQIFRKYLENQKVTLYSFENDQRYYDIYLDTYKSHPRHEVILYSDQHQLIDEIKKLGLDELLDRVNILSFVDCKPWEYRVVAIHELKRVSTILLVHDVDYLPHNGMLGLERAPIVYKPRFPFIYGKLRRENLGARSYDDISSSWVEVFPRDAGWFTGPPTLVASNFLDVKRIDFPTGCIILSQQNW